MSAKIIMHDMRGDYTVYEMGTLSQRFFASAIDAYMFGLTYSIFKLCFLIYFSKFIPMVYLDYIQILLPFIFFPIYYVYPLYRTGQTLGKRILNLKVVYKDKPDNLTFGTVMLRECVGKTLGLFFLLGYILAFLRADQRGFHDLIAKTKVVSLGED